MEKTYMKGWVSINIPINKKQNIDKIFYLADKLQEEKGITFDTGTGGDSMDWEIDFSLKGGKPEDVIEFLDKHDIEYTTRKVEDQAGG